MKSSHAEGIYEITMTVLFLMEYCCIYYKLSIQSWG